MRIPGSEEPARMVWAVRVEAIAQRQQRADGEAALRLIKEAAPPVGPNGEGSVVNRYA